MGEGQLVLNSEDRKDILNKAKTIYEAGAGEIFWKNFLAGFGRGLGGIFVYIFSLIIISLVFYKIVLPKFMPMINNLMGLSESLKSVQNIKPGAINLIPENLNLQKVLGQ